MKPAKLVIVEPMLDRSDLRAWCGALEAHLARRQLRVRVFRELRAIEPDTAYVLHEPVVGLTVPGDGWVLGQQSLSGPRETGAVAALVASGAATADVADGRSSCRRTHSLQVAVFFDVVVGMRIDDAPTRRGSPRPVDTRFHCGCGDRVSALADALARRLGPTLMDVGIGYFEMTMTVRGRTPRIVDIQAPALNRAVGWFERPSAYLGGYSFAIDRWMRLSQAIPRWRSVGCAVDAMSRGAAAL